MQEDNEFRFQELREAWVTPAIRRRTATKPEATAGVRNDTAASGCDSTVERGDHHDAAWRRAGNRHHAPGPSGATPPFDEKGNRPLSTTRTARTSRRRHGEPVEGQPAVRKLRRQATPDAMVARTARRTTTRTNSTRNSYQFILSGDYARRGRAFATIARFPTKAIAQASDAHYWLGRRIARPAKKYRDAARYLSGRQRIPDPRRRRTCC